ncbi:MAG: LysR family transcriptional regulator [Candidatus Pristimantibacillus sp.]
MQTFREVVKWGSYTRAAKELGYAQSSVTTQIQRLEEAYGVILFERYGRRMKLTLAGESLVHYADEITRLHRESKEVVSKPSAGALTIGTIDTLAAFYLPPFFQSFRKDYPDINLIIQPANEPYIIESVKDGILDMGFILDPPLHHPDIETVALREEELVIIAHPNHKIHEMPAIHIHELNNESLILTEEGCTYRAMLLKVLDASQVNVKISCEFGNLEAIKQCVTYGLGIALLPRIVVEAEIKKGQLVASHLQHPDLKFYTQLIYAKRKWLSEPLQDFLKLFSGSNDQNY